MRSLPMWLPLLRESKANLLEACSLSEAEAEVAHGMCNHSYGPPTLAIATQLKPLTPTGAAADLQVSNTDTKVLLSSGHWMPIIGLGTWMLNGDECVRAVVAALEIGYRAIDTAQVRERECGCGCGGKGVKERTEKRM